MGSNMEGNWQLVQLEAEKPIVIKGSGKPSFKRTFPLYQSQGVLIKGASSAEEKLLQQNRELYKDVKLLRGLWEEDKGESSGTYFPLAAPSGTEVLWGSAGHCAMPHMQRNWQCGYGLYVLQSSPFTKRTARRVVKLDWLRDGSELAEYVPSRPTQLINSTEVMPDFSFTLTKAPDETVQQVYIPSARQLVTGDAVCLLGFAHKPTATWARTFLATEADYELELEVADLEHRAPKSEEEYLLAEDVAEQRAYGLLDDICHPSHLVASPGGVVAASDRIIEHTCSTFPGMSGSPGVDIECPWQLLFVHMRADMHLRRNNYGYSVHHPLFIKAYEREVLPSLLTTASDLLTPEKLRCLRGYLEAHKHQLAEASVLRQVEQRC